MHVDVDAVLIYMYKYVFNWKYYFKASFWSFLQDKYMQNMAGGLYVV